MENLRHKRSSGRAELGTDCEGYLMPRERGRKEREEKETKCEHREKQSPLNSRIGMHLIVVARSGL